METDIVIPEIVDEVDKKKTKTTKPKKTSTKSTKKSKKLDADLEESILVESIQKIETELEPESVIIHEKEKEKEKEEESLTTEKQSGKWKYRSKKLKEKANPTIIKQSILNQPYEPPEEELENSILHLKISIKDIMEQNDLTGGNHYPFVYSPNVHEPLPMNLSGGQLCMEPLDSNPILIEKKEDLHQYSLEDIQKKREDELKCFHTENILDSNYSNLEKEEIPVIEEDPNAEPIFIHEKLEKDDKNVSTTMETIQRKIQKRNFIPVLYEYMDTNSMNGMISSVSVKKEWPKTTQYACWWCCHTFKEIPCFIPCKYEKQIFYLYGNFCSFNCAASYIFSKNKEDQWEQFSLLNLLYKKIFQKKDVKIQMAPPKECLKLFGGFMNIDEYRKQSLHMDRDYQIHYPNLIMLIPRIEEIQYELTDTSMQKKFIPMNDKLIHQIEKDLKLKRDMPIVDKNKTLLNFLQNKEPSRFGNGGFISL